MKREQKDINLETSSKTIEKAMAKSHTSDDIDKVKALTTICNELKEQNVQLKLDVSRLNDELDEFGNKYFEMSKKYQDCLVEISQLQFENAKYKADLEHFIGANSVPITRPIASAPKESNNSQKVNVSKPQTKPRAKQNMYNVNRSPFNNGYDSW